MQVPSKDREVLTPPRKKVKEEADELMKGIRKVPPAKFQFDDGRQWEAGTSQGALRGKAASNSQARASRVAPPKSSLWATAQHVLRGGSS